jgi:uncharacterized membrane protein
MIDIIYISVGFFSIVLIVALYLTGVVYTTPKKRTIENVNKEVDEIIAQVKARNKGVLK